MREDVIEFSRKNFSKPREEVQKYIDEWYKIEFQTEKQKKEVGKKEGYLKEKFGPGYVPRERRPKDEFEGAYGDVSPVETPAPKPPVPSYKSNSQSGGGNGFKSSTGGNSNYQPAKPKKEDKPTKITFPDDVKKALENKFTPPKEEIKEVSLSELANNIQSPAKSLKDPSPQNKNLLKEALFKALKDVKTEKPESTPEPTNPKPEIVNAVEESDEEKFVPVRETPKSISTDQKMKEVPEDILKRVLE